MIFGDCLAFRHLDGYLAVRSDCFPLKSNCLLLQVSLLLLAQTASKVHISPWLWAKQFSTSSACVTLKNIHISLIMSISNFWFLSFWYQDSFCLLILLDFSTAFNVGDHAVHIHHLSSFIHLRETTLAWFESYLTNHDCFVSKNSFSSCSHPVTWVFILGPSSFSSMCSLSAISFTDSNFHEYADDTQIYFSSSYHSRSTDTLSAYLSDIETYMSAKFLQLNIDKMEAILGSHQCLLSNLFNLPRLWFYSPTFLFENCGMVNNEHWCLNPGSPLAQPEKITPAHALGHDY